MFKKLFMALALVALTCSFAGCLGTPDISRGGKSALHSQEQAKQNVGPANQTTGKHSATATKETVPQNTGHSQTVNSKTVQTAQSTQTAGAVDLKINRSGIRSLLFQSLTSNADRQAGQKEIINLMTIQKILDCIEQAPKTKTTYSPVPGTILILSSKNTDFKLSLQHGDILQYNGRFYQADAKLRRDLLELYTQAGEEAQPVKLDETTAPA